MNRLWTTWRTRIGCFKQIENAISLIIGRLSLVPSNFNNHKLSKYTLETPISLRFEHICHSTWRQCVAALSVFKTTPAMLLKLCRCHKGFFPSSSLKHCQWWNNGRNRWQGDEILGETEDTYVKWNCNRHTQVTYMIHVSRSKLYTVCKTTSAGNL